MQQTITVDYDALLRELQDLARYRLAPLWGADAEVSVRICIYDPDSGAYSEAQDVGHLAPESPPRWKTLADDPEPLGSSAVIAFAPRRQGP